MIALQQPLSSSNKAEEDAAIKNAALSLLARREHSQRELVTKLSRRFSDKTKIEQQVEALAESELQSDERFIESYIRAKKNQGKGPKYIKQELRHKGVSEYLVASYIYEDDEDWLLLAEAVYHKKFGDTPVEDSKEKAKRIRFMVSRGFTPESVFRLLSV